MAELISLTYPRHVHLPSHFGDWRSRVVTSADDCAAALAEGFSLSPVIVPDGEPLDVVGPADAVESSEPVKRKPRRPKNLEG